MHAEIIVQHSISTDAPWGRTSITWHDVSRVRITYEHCAELSDESMRDDPVLFPYARSTFEVQVPDTGRCYPRHVSRRDSARYPASLRSAPPPYAPDPELERSCRVDIAAWLSVWIAENTAEWARGQAIAAHNAYVTLYHAQGDDEGTRAERRRLLRRVLPVVPWFVTHSDTPLRTWALLHYVLHYSSAANAEDALRREPDEPEDS